MYHPSNRIHISTNSTHNSASNKSIVPAIVPALLVLAWVIKSD